MSIRDKFSHNIERSNNTNLIKILCWFPNNINMQCIILCHAKN